MQKVERNPLLSIKKLLNDKPLSVPSHTTLLDQRVESLRNKIDFTKTITFYDFQELDNLHVQMQQEQHHDKLLAESYQVHAIDFKLQYLKEQMYQLVEQQQLILHQLSTAQCHKCNIWIHCNEVFYELGSCGHVLCAMCIDKTNPKQCTLCRVQPRRITINDIINH